jgi:peptidyl-prolyl cis-trans isomerase D
LKAQQAQLSELTPEQIRALKEIALEQLITEVLLLEQAETWKLSLTEAEVKDYIRNIPMFQEEGRFSLVRFKHYLRFQGQTEETFAEELQRSLVVQKTEDFIRDSAKITEDEVDSLYNLFNERIVLDYVVFGPEPFLEGISITPGDIQAYFEEHLADYQIPETVEVEFLKIHQDIYLPEVQVSDQEVEERYGATQDRWKVSKQVLARHILLRAEEEEDPKARMKVLQQAENLLTRLQEGEDFDQLANEYSEDPETASKGGLLGWKRQGELPEGLNKALFEEMSPGQLSDRPIKSPDGFHILKLDEVQSESVRPLAEVKEVLEDEIKQDKARQMASELAEQAYMYIFQGATFEETAKNYKLPLEKTPPFSLQAPWEGPAAGSQFREAAFSLNNEEDFSDVIEEDGAFFILRLVQRHPSREPELAEVEEEVREDLRETKAGELAKQEANEFLNKVSERGKSFSEVAEEDHHDVLTSLPVGRFLQHAPIPADLIRQAFSLASDERLIPESFPHGNQFIVATVKERIPPDPSDQERHQKMYRAMLLRDKKESAFREWMEMIRSRSKIKTYKAYEELL